MKSVEHGELKKLYECCEYVDDLERDIEAFKKECEHGAHSRRRVAELRERYTVARACIRE